VEAAPVQAFAQAFEEIDEPRLAKIIDKYADGSRAPF
jgi:hypothetical protein